MASFKLFAVFAFFIVVVAMATALPQGYAGSADNYKPGYAGRPVKIQVYRGPNKDYGKSYDKSYDDGAFAPSGFYVNQPVDNKAYIAKY